MKERYTFYVHSNSKRYPLPPVFVSGLSGLQGFSSLYAVTEEDAAALARTGTIAGFNGNVWSERLWIDCDTYAAADQVEAILREMELDFIAFDTGNRGAHFGVLRDAAPSHLLPRLDREWVRHHLPAGAADTSIYTTLHLFRLPGTVHETGGRPKRLVLEQSGKVLKHGPLPEKYVASPTNVVSDKVKSIFQCYPVMKNTVPTKVGTRHATYVKLLYSLRDEMGADIGVARFWLGEVNKMAEEPKTEQELEQLVGSIYK